MQFKLIPVDSDKPNKIELKTGTHVFGRGKLLVVDDKRISRKHGQLEVTDESLIVTALHQNPCFYRRVGSTEIEVLKQNNSVHLSSGDRLGLLLGSYWFEVLQCVPSNEKDTEEDTIPINSAYGEETDNEVDSRLDATNIESNNNDKMESETVPPKDDHAAEETLNRAQNVDNKDCENENKPNGIERNLDFVEEQIVSENSESPQKDQSDPTHCGSPSLLASNENQEDVNNERPPSPANQNSPHKRSHDNDEQASEEVKKIKTEPEVKQEVKTEPIAGASTSNDNDKDKPASPAQPVLRERCMYGASCYRRNPAHRAQFSHPRDADWGEGERAPCPWGGGCRRRDPRHWRDHAHPPGKLPPPPQQQQQPGQRVVYRHGNIFYINAQTVNFYDDHFEAEDSDGNSVDYDYEF